MIHFDVQGRIGVITLDRPEARNAINAEMAEAIESAIDRLEHDDELWVGILTHNGSAFCAGADLSRGGETFDHEAAGTGMQRDGGGLLTLRIFECMKPVISACNGPAVGIGATMQCAMDIRLASENARYGFVFSKRGIVPEACSSWFLPKLVGVSTALEWTYSGRIFGADEAKERGFVRSVHSAETLLDEAQALAREFATQTSSISVAMARHMMWRLPSADHPMEAHKIDSRGVYFTGKSADAREGVQSFLEKRPAEFPGNVSTDMPEFFPWWETREFE